MRQVLTILFACALVACGSDTVSTVEPSSGDLLFPAMAAVDHDRPAGDAVYDCPAVPEVVQSLKTASKYDQSDPTKSTIDPAKARAYRRTMEPLVEFSQGVTRAANFYVASGGQNKQAGDCARSWLTRWAADNAITDMRSKQALQARQSRLVAIALAYIQVRDMPGFAAGDRQRIEAWLAGMAHETVQYYDQNQHTASYRNNHRYWSGLAAAAVGLAVDDKSLREWGYDSYRAGAADIDSRGYLPAELKRASRALDYHLYAAAPLMMLAEIARTDGLDLYSAADGAIHRLVARTAASISDPSDITAIAGAPQTSYTDGEGKVPPHKLGWLEIYVHRHGTADLRRLADAYRPIKATGLGGDLTMLFGKDER